MKRTISIVLTLAMLISLFTVFFVTEVSAATVIKNSSPAIPATVGQKITLSDYSVIFDGDSTATSGVTWKQNGTTITSFTPSAKGVTTLVASSGSKTKNIYVVAKNSSESEYVLYEANMADFASVSALTSAGWTLPDSTNTPTSISGGALAIDGTRVQGTAYLPAWLGDFGDYGFTANVKVNSANESTRWFAMVYRSDNRAGTANHFQMCIRDNTTAANGIEFSENIGSWNVIAKGSASHSTMTDAYRNVSITVNGGDLSYFIGSTQVLYLTSSAYTAKSGLTKGHLGITASGASLSVKSVKVTLQLGNTVPEQIPSNLSLIYNNNHDTANLATSIANVQKVSSATAANLSGLSVAYIDLTGGADATAALKACVSAGVVPTFYITTNAQADKVASAISSAGKYDVNVISNSASVLAYMRNKNSKVRTGLSYDLSSAMADGNLTVAEAETVRKAVRSAPATFMVIESKYATQQAINEIRKFAVAVWVNVKSTPNTDAFRLEALTALTAGAHGIITSSASAVSTLIATSFTANTVTRPSYSIGHAGNYDIAEENTMESFISAYENGAAILELDMGITSDGVPVLLHDNTLWRTTTYKNEVEDKTKAKNIWEMTWAEVQKYTVVSTKTGVDTGKPIPKFEELLQYCKGKDVKLFVEFKWHAHNMIPKTIELINQYGMMSQCDFLSFYGNCIGAVQQLAPGASTSFIFNNNSTDVKGTNATYAQSLISLDYWITTAQGSKSTISPPRYTPITKDVMQAATDRGITIWPWTYDTNSANAGFFAGVDGMTMVNAQDMANMVFSVSSSGVDMFVGQTYTGGSLVATRYNRTTFKVTGENTVAAIVSGDAVKLENGKLVAVKTGTAKVILGCKTKTYAGQDYVVYSQPVTVTVGASAGASMLVPLMDVAETATINSLPEADLNTLRELYNKAKSLISASNPAESEIKATANAMSDLISKFIVVSYTTTAPNYDYWDTASANLFYDDGVRLMDGKKQKPAGDSSAYSAWKSTSSGVVDITVDYGSAAAKDTFSGYFAHGNWGVYAPTAMDIYYSNDGNSWKKAETTLTTVETKASTTELPWALSTLTSKSATEIKARYFRFKITPGYSNGFIWVDEIELTNSNDKLGYITSVNKKIVAGDAVIFTSDFGAVSNQTANIKYAGYVVAKWNKDYNAYIITSVQETNLADKTYNLASDEIILAAHEWENDLAGEQGVVGSSANRAKIHAAEVGQAIRFYGINSDWSFSVAPAFEIVDAEIPTHTHTAVGNWVSDKNNHWKECSCGEDLNKAAHTAGAWEVKTPATVDKAGEQIKKCTVCQYVVETKEIPKLEPTHTHSAVGDWKYDDKEHWKECSCGEKLNKAAHDADDCSVCAFVAEKEDEKPTPDPEPKPDEETKIMLGDVNDSKEIDSMDYVLVKRAYFGTFDFNEDQFARGDVNKSGDIDSMDYVLIKRAYFGTFSFS